MRIGKNFWRSNIVGQMLSIDIRDDLLEYTFDKRADDRALDGKHIIFGFATAKLNGSIKGLLDSVNRAWKLM